MMELYQFRCSHFCEKVRWALDYKGIPFRAVDLVPGRHVRVVRRLAKGSSVPVLVDGEHVVQGSGAIISHLDQLHQGRRLTPGDALAASMATEWERYLDTQIGVPLRLWFYHHLLPDRAATLDFLLQGAPWHARPLYTLTWPVMRKRMRSYMNINEDTAGQAERTLLAAFERLDEALAERRFLIGSRFSRADLSACALLGRFCLPASEADAARQPAGVRALRERVQARPFYRWVGQMYAEYRHPAMPAGAPVED